MIEYRQATVESGARGMPGACYTSAAVYESEQERIFRSGWVCAGRAEDLPEAGAFCQVRVGGERLLLVRGEDERLRAFYNVCRHRGARLCVVEEGWFEGKIQCPYHGWTYALDGELMAARHMAGVEGFDRSQYPLHAAALAEWEGFVFVSLAREPLPFEAAFAPLFHRFAAWGLPELRRGGRIEYQVEANWKLLVENYSECYHCALIHPALCRLSPPDSGRNDLTEGPFLGGYMDLSGAGSMTTTGQTTRPPLPHVAGADLNRVYYYALFPNLLLSLHPDYVMAHFLEPEAPGSTRVRCDWYFDPATMARPDFDASDAVDFWDLTNRQDWRICELTQQGVSSRAYTPGPYAHAEGLVWAFDQHWRRAMEAEGR